MASMIQQERVLGFALGLALGSFTAAYNHRFLWRSTANLSAHLSIPSPPPPPSFLPQVPQPLFDKSVREELAHSWNQGIDKTLGRLVAAIGSKGW